MPNTTVRAAAESVPEVNRRRLLLGLASASAVAATVSIPQADATPLENPELIRLGDELLPLEAECHATAAAANSILTQWKSSWPLAPEEIVYRDKLATAGEKERGLWGNDLIRPGEARPLRVESSKNIAVLLDCFERNLAGKRIRSEARRACIAAKIETLKKEFAIAKQYEAECARVLQASGLRAAQERESDAAHALSNHVDAIMGTPETSMAGIMIKAQAMAVWSKFPRCGIFVVQAREWGPKFGAAIVRLSEGGAA